MQLLTKMPINLFLFNYLCIMAKEQSSLRERVRAGLREPMKFKVIIHNDDFTTMDFVVRVLMVVFYKTMADAEMLMLNVHRKGQAVVGVYSYDIALTKVDKATRMAREEGFPLRLTIKQD